MVRYILPPSTPPLQDITDDQLIEGLSKFSNSIGFIRPGHKFSTEDRKHIEGLLEILSLPGDGNTISYLESRKIVSAFNNEPNNFVIEKKHLDNFFSNIQKLSIDTNFPNYEVAYRFYIGFESIVEGLPNSFSVIVMPIASPKPGIKSRDHSKDIEMEIFKQAQVNFFGLKISASGIGLECNMEVCKKLIQKKDFSAKELVYFSDEALQEFIKNLETTVGYSKLFLELGRLVNGDITLIVTFLDVNDNPIISKVPIPGSTAFGFCFDQGNLVPPPFGPIADSHFS